MPGVVVVTVLAGTSGWQYRDWRGAFYPPGVPQRRWLEHYAQQFAAAAVAHRGGQAARAWPGWDAGG